MKGRPMAATHDIHGAPKRVLMLASNPEDEALGR